MRPYVAFHASLRSALQVGGRTRAKHRQPQLLPTAAPAGALLWPPFNRAAGSLAFAWLPGPLMPPQAFVAGLEERCRGIVQHHLETATSEYAMGLLAGEGVA